VSRERLDPEERSRLEREREFLLQSLDDLQLEHESGGIDDESYAQLHDDYTARAAAAIRTLRDGVDTRPPPAAPKPLRGRLAVVSVVVVFALAAGVSLAYALGARLPGQTASGNTASPGASTATTNAAGKALARKLSELEGQVNAKPDDYQLRLDLARAYEENSDLPNALKQSDAAVHIDPKRPEGQANLGRLLYLASDPRVNRDKNQRDQLVAEALAAFTTAIAVGPDYADSYYFRSVLFAATNELPRAQTDLQQYLVLAPNGQWADRARSLLAQVTKAVETPSTTVPPTTSATKN
jgi:cytochrome c-type biogenesis protein CcmH/NrfG